MFADLSGVNTFSYDNASGMEQIRFAKMNFFNARMETEDKFVDAIKDIKRQVNDSPLRDNAIIHSPIMVFWEVFLELQPKLILLIGVNAAVIFLITLLFFSLDVVTALITCLSCVMIVVEIYGLSVSLMSFNIFIAALTLMSMGLSVEFTVHLAAAFSLGHGSSSDRLGSAMAHTFPALFEGSVTTLLGIIPLAFHPIMFIVKYVFGILAITISVGLVNGLVFMPAMLALMSPLLPYVSCRRDNQTTLRTLKVDVSSNSTPTLLASSGEARGRRQSNKNMASVVPSDS
jgi:predicted RND superfamily exporter protein